MAVGIGERELAGITELRPDLGADGWGDGRLGDYWSLQVQLNDWALIDEFKRLDDRTRLKEKTRLLLKRE